MKDLQEMQRQERIRYGQPVYDANGMRLTEFIGKLFFAQIVYELSWWPIIVLRNGWPLWVLACSVAAFAGMAGLWLLEMFVDPSPRKELEQANGTLWKLAGSCRVLKRAAELKGAQVHIHIEKDDA